ncbi:MAG: response regulator [Ignavibacteriaceae bacterium]|jgi:DNA-binding LytR/AlgR family response regulator|nr:response regulator [Ignavibacteriaceae bacterium]
MKKILIIEDELPVRMGIKDLLEIKNYKVFDTGSGKEGLKIAEEELPDLIICDIKMPEMDGYSVLKKISENENLATIPFIFLTAKTEMTDLRYGMNLGADDYIVKPFLAKDLYKAIEVRINKNEKNNEAIDTKHNSEKQQTKKLQEHLFITEGNKPQIIKIQDIECITAFNEYTNVYVCNSKKFVIRKSLREWESVLPNTMFIRIHRSTIINYEHVDRIEKFYARSYLVYLKNIKQPFVISQRYLSKLKKNLFF